MMALKDLHPAFEPSRAVLLATAMISGYVAGTCWETVLLESLPAETTIEMPRLWTAWTMARSAGLSPRLPGRPRLMLTTRMGGVARLALSAAQSSVHATGEGAP